MAKTLSILTLATVLLLGASAIAADKVVVVPLSSASTAGTNGQVQYNDGGKTAGAEVYYEKAGGKLETTGEIRTVDESGEGRLWGKGRPGIELMTHTDPNGYCTTSSGIHYALSKNYVSWFDAEVACPIGTWVCTRSEFPESGSCDINTISTCAGRTCAGDPYDCDNHSALDGWLSDIFNQQPNIALLKNTSNHANATGTGGCLELRVWCCWK